MAEGSIYLSVVTPVKKLVENIEVKEITLPTCKGQIEVLPQHTELMTVLETGELRFIKTDGTKQSMAVSYGYAEVQNNKVLVLAQTAETAAEINIERARLAQKRAEEALAGGVEFEHFDKYELKMRRAMVRQQIGN